MSQLAGRKGQPLIVRALWRFGPAAIIAILLAVPSVHGGAHSHGARHAPAPAPAGHIHRSQDPAIVRAGTVRAGTVRAGTVSNGPGGTSPFVRRQRPGHFVRPD
jgi:hypothetical protein